MNSGVIYCEIWKCCNNCTIVIDAFMCCNCRIMDSGVNGGENKPPVSAVTIGGDTIEVVEDDDISVVSDDGGDEEINPSGNVWPRSSVNVELL